MPETASHKRPTLFLLDGMALIYRAYYALMPAKMQTKSGFPTGAAFGFINTLTKVLENYSPDYIAVAFDSKEKTFRHERYPDYKANRPLPPDDLLMQLEKIYAIVDAYGIRNLKMPGYEADDIMGTLAKKFEKECDVFLVTPDKDFAQLVNSHIQILKPSKDDDKFERYGRNEVKEKYGVYPEQFIDMLTLMGDSSDNIPGVDGIGPKTAAALISEYGSLESLYKQVHLIKKPKLRENLLKAQDQLELTRFLVTIKTDVEINEPIESFKQKPIDADSLFPLLEELEFKQFLSRLKRSAKVEADATSSGMLFEESDTDFNFGANIDANYRFDLPTPQSVGHYTLVDTPERFAKLLEKLAQAKEFALDTETTSLDALEAELVMLSFSLQAREAFAIDFRAGLSREEVLRTLKPILENPAVRKVGQNIKYDWLVLRRYGIELSPPYFDTMLASYVLNPDAPHNLDELSETYLKFRTVRYDELVGTGKGQKSIYEVPVEDLKNYACQDADMALQLKATLEEKLLLEPALMRICEEIEFPLLRVLAEMEWSGIKIDSSVLGEISAALDTAIQEAAEAIYKEAGEPFNIDSPKQIGEVLFEKMKLPAKKRTKTGYSTDVRVLEELAEEYPIAEKILEYRSLQKLKNTYVDTLPTLVRARTGKVHTSFNQSVTATGRLSSSNPNLQNIPIRTEIGRQIRRAFVASSPDYALLSADYSQIELRIAAEFSGDETMQRAFKNGEDIHSATAKIIFETEAITKEMRRKAKEVNFGVLYGIQPFGLAQRLDISQAEAKTMIENYKAKYPKIFAFMERVLEQARTKGYVETALGRRRYFPNIKHKSAAIRNAEERAAINAPIQGTAADMIKLAMIEIDEKLRTKKLGAKMVLQVHDELLFDAPKVELETLGSLVQVAMVRAAKEAGLKTVPVVVEIGTGENWLAAH
ncbi:MAG: DNA polymerase I [Chloroherpetonaceae bacterium]|nr:DNA polymerase I [Chloroherpetonaceae bacterium]